MLFFMKEGFASVILEEGQETFEDAKRISTSQSKSRKSFWSPRVYGQVLRKLPISKTIISSN